MKLAGPLVVASAFVAAGLVGRELIHVKMAPPLTSGAEKQITSLPAKLAAAADALTSQAPVAMGATTTLTGATASGSELTYYLKTNQEYDEADIVGHNRRAACADEQAFSAISQGATLHYIYTMPSGTQFTETVADCDPPAQQAAAEASGVPIQADIAVATPSSEDTGANSERVLPTKSAVSENVEKPVRRQRL